MVQVSVIVPVYNVEAYLGDCLDSLLGQTLREIEVLCVDDGSTDGSARVLADYAARDPRVRLFTSPHAGAFRAREVGVKAAVGKYVHFMDADDLLETCALERLCALADRDNLDQIVFGSSVFCEADVSPEARAWAKGLNHYYAIPRNLCGKVMAGMELMEALLLADHFHVSPPLRLIRMTAVKGPGVAYGFPDARSRADNYFTPISLYYSKRACAVPDKFYRRRVRNDSISTGEGAEQRHFRNMLQVLLEFYRFKPFKDDLLRPDAPIARFAAKLMLSMGRWAWKFPAEARMRILTETMARAGEEESAYLYHVSLLAIRNLKRRPKPFLVDGALAVLRHYWRRLRGRGEWVF